MRRPGQGNRLTSGQASPPFCEDDQRDTVRGLINNFPAATVFQVSD